MRESRRNRRRTAGGRSAFDDAFPALYTLAYRVAFRILGTRPDAEDVASEVMARTYVRWAQLVDRPEPWVATVSSNLAIDGWRKRQRSLPADEPPPATPDVTATDRVALVHALGSLPRRQREVVTLRYLADLPVADVAAQLGCSDGAVKQHAWRGLAALRSHMGIDLVDPDLDDVEGGA